MALLLVSAALSACSHAAEERKPFHRMRLNTIVIRVQGRPRQFRFLLDAAPRRPSRCEWRGVHPNARTSRQLDTSQAATANQNA
jgi:hypothetical protein